MSENQLLVQIESLVPQAKRSRARRLLRQLVELERNKGQGEIRKEVGQITQTLNTSLVRLGRVARVGQPIPTIRIDPAQALELSACSVCERGFALRNDGTIRKHNYNGDICPGSRLLPADNALFPVDALFSVEK